VHGKQQGCPGGLGRIPPLHQARGPSEAARCRVAAAGGRFRSGRADGMAFVLLAWAGRPVWRKGGRAQGGCVPGAPAAGAASRILRRPLRAPLSERQCEEAPRNPPSRAVVAVEAARASQNGGRFLLSPFPLCHRALPCPPPGPFPPRVCSGGALGGGGCSVCGTVGRIRECGVII